MPKLEKYGQVVCDMHYGLTIPVGYEFVDRVDADMTSFSRVIERTVEAQTGKPYWYTNKELVVTGFGLDGTITCAYSYDGHRMGLIRLREV